MKYFFFFLLWYSSGQAQKFEEHRIGVDKGELYCQTTGSGEPVLFIHGGPGLNQSYLIPAFSTLSNKYKLIFYDQRSSGKSALSVKATMNFASFAADVDSIRKYFGIEKLHIVAHSWGCLTAIEYATKYPEHIASLVLCNPVPADHSFDQHMQKNILQRSTPYDSLRKAEIIASEEFKLGKTSAVLQMMLLSFKLNFCDTLNMQNLQLNLPEDFVVASLSYEGWKTDMKNYNFTPLLNTVKCPVLILHGSCDIIPLESAEKYRDNLHTAKLVVYQDAGHFSFAENGKHVVKDIRKFLKPILTH